MTIQTILFGKMQIPDDKKEIKKEINRCEKRFCDVPTRYLQARIDALYDALDEFRKE